MGKARRFLAGILTAVVAFGSDGIVMAANSIKSELKQENIIETVLEQDIQLKENEQGDFTGKIMEAK